MRSFSLAQHLCRREKQSDSIRFVLCVALFSDHKRILQVFFSRPQLYFIVGVSQQSILTIIAKQLSGEDSI